MKAGGIRPARPAPGKGRIDGRPGHRQPATGAPECGGRTP